MQFRPQSIPPALPRRHLNQPQAPAHASAAAPVEMDASPSPPDGRRPPPRRDAPDPGESYLARLGNLKDWFHKVRVDHVLPSVKAIFASPTPSQVPDELSLFRAQIYQGVVNGPALTREQELALQKQLDHVLEQVQTCVKALDLNPIYESDLLRWPYPGSRDHKHHSSISHRPKFRPSLVPVSTTDDDVRKVEANQKKLVKIIDNFSSSTKALVAARLAKHELSAEFAQLMYLRIELLNRNVQLAVESSGRCFSFTGLLGRLTKPYGLTSLFDNLSFFGLKLQEIATMTECVVDNIGTSPGHFSRIGKETDSILSDDFCIRKMKLNSDPFENMSFALGAEDGGGLSVHQFLMKLKKDNSSVFLSAKSVVAPPYGNASGNAIPNGLAVANPNVVQGVAVVNDNAPADIALIKLALDEVYGKDFKCTLHCPYPSLHAKLEVKATDPYLAYGGYVGLHRNSKMNVSFLLGVKSAGVGMQYTHDYQSNAGSFGCGFRFRSSLATIGFTFNEPGTYKATVCQKIIDSATTVAAVASYSQVDNEERGARLTVGVKHSFDPSLFVKARAGSEGISVAMKKSFCAGKFTVKAASHVDVRDPWRSPKVGVLFSCRR